MTWYARRKRRAAGDQAAAHADKQPARASAEPQTSEQASEQTGKQVAAQPETQPAAPQANASGEPPCKISDEFARRLAALAPQETVRAVVMPAPYMQPSSEQSASRRLRGADRQAMLREARQHTEASFQEIDKVLARTGGQRLSTTGNAFGYILIETNAAGIDAISALDWVNAVLEDQPIHPQRGPHTPDRFPERSANQASDRA